MQVRSLVLVITAILVGDYCIICKPDRNAPTIGSLNNEVNHGYKRHACDFDCLYESSPICGEVKVVLDFTGRDADDASDDDVFDGPDLDKIMGGSNAIYGESPWMALILYNSTEVCGGTIISEFWVLSSADCFFNYSQSLFRIGVGLPHVSHHQDPRASYYQIEKLIIHPQYRPGQVDYDIALIKIKAPLRGGGIQFTDYVQPICLPTSTETARMVLLYGWGYTSDSPDNKPSQILKKQLLPIVPFAQCNTGNRSLLNARNVFCAGDFNRPTDVCGRDSGGPALYGYGTKVVCGKLGMVTTERHQNNNFFREDDDEGEDEDEADDDNFDWEPNMNRIFGGRNVVHGQAPYHANIMLDSDTQGIIPFCGGAIISEYWIVTAAQCFFNVDRWKLFVIVGDHTRNRVDKGEQSFTIKQFFLHPNYTEGSMDYNIALVYITRKPGIGGIQFNSKVQPVCLPLDSQNSRTRDILRVSGMGLTSRHNPNAGYSTVLRRMKVSAFPCTGSEAVKTSRIFCLGRPRESTICQGDNGAPAVSQKRHVFVLSGIVAYAGSEACPASTYVANVFEYRNWINGVIATVSSPGEEVLPIRPT